MGIREIRKQLERLKGELNAKRKPISEWRPGMNEQYMGVDLSQEVDIHTLLTLEHNAIIHEAYRCGYGNEEECKDRQLPLEGITQQWEDMEVPA